MAPNKANKTYKKHVLMNLNPLSKEFDRNEALFDCREHLQEVVSRCVNANQKNRPTKCACMKWVNEDENALEVERVALYMIYWAGLKREAKNSSARGYENSSKDS